jgi:uncharacterized protein
VNEEPFFFAGAGGDLFAVLHQPDGTARAAGFVFCHPFGEEKLWTHRVFVTFARELARRGYAVLRFKDASIATALEDIERAIGELQARSGVATISLLGLRLGATLAAVTAERRRDVDTLVLWAPIVDGAKYAQELLRINMTTQLAVFREVREDRATLVAGMREGRTANVDGYEMGYAMYEQLSALVIGKAPASIARRVLIVQLDRGASAPPAADLQRVATAFTGATLVQAQEDPFWKEIERFYETAPNLSAATLSWLEPS